MWSPPNHKWAHFDKSFILSSFGCDSEVYEKRLRRGRERERETKALDLEGVDGLVENYFRRFRRILVFSSRLVLVG